MKTAICECIECPQIKASYFKFITELNHISYMSVRYAYNGSIENIVHELEVFHDICTRKNIMLDTFKLIEK